MRRGRAPEKFNAPRAGTPDAAEPVDAAVRDAGTPKDTGTPEEGLTGNCAFDATKIYSVKRRNEPFPGALPCTGG